VNAIASVRGAQSDDGEATDRHDRGDFQTGGSGRFTQLLDSVLPASEVAEHAKVASVMTLWSVKESTTSGVELLLDADYMTGQVLCIDGGMSIS
jgi:hypothetical protein